MGTEGKLRKGEVGNVRIAGMDKYKKCGKEQRGEMMREEVGKVRGRKQWRIKEGQRSGIGESEG